ncbi:MAG TPA: hypothetical protein PK119_01735 [Candidatus Paceibacterota bacterium]|nr:hypothetical protein [Candidatus Paceibacterota bacterium]
MKNYLFPFLKNGKAFFLAYDHGFEHGAGDFNEKNLDPEYILDLAVKGGFTGIVLQKGIAEKYYFNSSYQKKVPLILKLNGKTNLLLEEEPYAAINCSVEYAKKLGAQAVGYTIYLGSKFEAKMFEDFGQIQEKAHNLDMAAILWTYPKQGFENDHKITEYAGRIGLELGADIIKLKYFGDKKNFKQAIKLAGKTKVVLSGGQKLDEEKFLAVVSEVMELGAIGVAVGRNVWQRENPLEITEKLRKLVLDSPRTFRT